MEPRKALEATSSSSGLAREHMGVMGAMGETHMEWWETRRNRGAHRGWLSPWQLPHSPPGYSANKVWAFLEFLKLTLHGYWLLLMFQAGSNNDKEVGRLWRLAPPPKEDDHENKDDPVSPLLPTSSITRLPLTPHTARLPHNETDKVYLKVEVHKKLTSKLRHIKIIPQIRKKEKGGTGAYWYQFWTHQSGIDWLIAKVNESILNLKLLKLCRNLWSTTRRLRMLWQQEIVIG